MPAVSPVNEADADTVPVTGDGVPVTVVPLLQSLDVLHTNDTAVEVDPTVNVPFRVAEV